MPALKGNIGELLERRAERVPAELAAEAMDHLAELPDGDRLCHGDFHPGNVLLTSAGPRVIDWAGASRGDPLADVCRCRLIIRMSAVPPQAPALVRRLDGAGRSWLLRTYLCAYGKPDPSALDRWQRLMVIARLAEGIDSERTALLKLVGRA